MSEGEQVELVLRVLLALGLGALIGLQREFRGHEAGIRTTALVCTGAAIFGLVSNALGDSRVAAGVVQGIGFLGAGLIFRRGDTLHNLTTATTVWVAAGVGLLVSQDLWLAAVLTALMAVVMLELAPVSDLVYRHGRPRRSAKERRLAREARELEEDES